jgi:hypothetical protein
MTNKFSLSSDQMKTKARELGISEEALGCALSIIAQNRDLVNALDHGAEMDDYIYRAILKRSFEQRKYMAERGVYNDDEAIQQEALKDLALLSREELATDPFYRAVLPLIAKLVINEPILRLHAEEASAIVLELADFKRRHRATSVTEIIVKQCREEIANFQHIEKTNSAALNTNR